MLHWEGRMKTGPKWPVNRSQYVPLQICLYWHFFFKRPYLGNETRYLRSVSAKMTATYRASIHSFMKVTSPHFYPVFWRFSWKKPLFRGVPGGPNWATTVQNMPLGPFSNMQKRNDSGKPNWSFPGMFCDLFRSQNFAFWQISLKRCLYVKNWRKRAAVFLRFRSWGGPPRYQNVIFGPFLGDFESFLVLFRSFGAI